MSAVRARAPTRHSGRGAEAEAEGTALLARPGPGSATVVGSHADRPWYGLDDTYFVRGVEGAMLNGLGNRLATRTWLPPAVPPSADTGVVGALPG